MSKHTPGPWIAEVGECLTSVKAVVESKYFTIAYDVSNDDAHLIAAAPELLDLARLILKEWEAPTDGVQKGELIARLSQYAQEARTAIAKAEGKNS